MSFTEQRFMPGPRGPIAYEHLHRYAIAARFSAGKRILDIACGEGYGSALLARSAQHVVGVDANADAVEHARRSYYYANLRFVTGSCTEIPLGDASVDVVASFETIEHVDEHEKMLDELRRVLVPGGTLILSSPNRLIASDLSGFRNAYDVRELYFAELRDLLARRFRHVTVYGQRLGASSIVHPLSGAASEDAAWYNGGFDAVGSGLPVLGNPVYFVAICSDEQVACDLSSAYLDPADDLIERIEAELTALRGQVAAIGAAPAPLALPRPDESDRSAAGGENARVAELETRLAEEAESLRSANEELQRVRAALGEERTRSARLVLQLAELRAAHGATSEREPHAETGELQSLREHLAACTAALQRAQADSRTLREVLSSRSWKLTTPLRRAASLLRR